MPDMKDIVTDDRVKNALKSDAVTTTVKAQIKSTLDKEIDSAVYTALVDLPGVEQAPTTVTGRRAFAVGQYQP
ncbi:hypothetical protein CIH92_10325 [Salmonella enterica]|nr:hypothetical protein [Salmonella enterica]EEG7825545.1 DUF826 domain-containing protein [Salmonella enterica]